MWLKKQGRITPAQIILIGFMALILAGTGLLMLPVSTQDGAGASFSDALFTATSATCVTGLIVQDTATYWSGFGQAVLLALIQTGGMGVVTMAIAVEIFSGRKIGLRQRFVMQESISAPQMGGIVRITGFILKATLLFEGAGAVLLAFRFCPRMGFFRGLWYAVFHSVSAFCNAGFDLMGVEAKFASLTGFAGDPVVNAAVMLLIITGGIGFFVWDDIRQNKWRFRAYRLQTKIVLTTTAVLLAAPFAFYLAYEFTAANWGELTAGQRVWAALFQAVSPRTAGFNTVDLAQMQTPSLLVMIVLMLVGGSPGSTAGGFKTTSLAVVFLCIRAVLCRRDSIQVFGRRFPPEVLRNTVTILFLYVLLFLLGGVALCCLDGIPMLAALFESASAVGTVGLTLGVTTQLGTASRIILILMMLFGRVGAMTMLYAFTGNFVPSPAQMPQEKITVG